MPQDHVLLQHKDIGKAQSTSRHFDDDFVWRKPVQVISEGFLDDFPGGGTTELDGFVEGGGRHKVWNNERFKSAGIDLGLESAENVGFL
ncbi:hypothetical protein D9758_010127 [Tetrapyrgos nigripes]|uniref:Uncharacterized protein n=1 Tax=Tetrapyrgos nigripes TaxID=182062 RepID=A0A8H5CT94_9AGAR|nr:hypothetical protein D9758_010127 [Tetrapyrgos nigripes]